MRTSASNEHGIELEPRESSACPVGFAVQSDYEVSLFVGRYETTVDIYDRDPSSLLETLKKFVTAILEGRYEEEVRLVSESGQDILGKARGVFHFPDGDHKISHSHVPSWGRRGPWQRIAYDTY